MFGLRVPESLGGLGLGPLASAAFSEALGSSTFGDST
jgi:alkylation response protein AidB-like acyl-CoA dehydrogenase